MFKFFRPKRADKPLRLVSLHIPKTAGTSFRNILKSIYGEEDVIRLDISIKTEQTRINEAIYEKPDLPSHIQVIHGHFTPRLLHERFNIPQDIPVITWLRHPVERVLSNFYYLEKRLKEELDEEGKNLDILSKMQRTLMEYAADELNRNRQHKFLEGIALDQFAFVGIQEYYSEDLKALAQLLDWPSYEEVKHNITGSKYTQVTKEQRQQIAEWNHLDMALYESGMAIRAKRDKQ